jgi:hypothetical protein
MRRVELDSIPALLVILGAIIVMAFIIFRFDNFYLKPICLRFGEEKQMEYESYHASSRYERSTYCRYRLYHDDGSYKTTVHVPISSMQLTPVERFLGITRWFLIVGILIPGVWLARRLAGMDD